MLNLGLVHVVDSEIGPRMFLLQGADDAWLRIPPGLVGQRLQVGDGGQ